MISRIRTLLALTALTALVAAPTASAKHPKDFVGIDSQDTFQAAFESNFSAMDTNLSAQAATGIKIHRQPFTWESIETSRGNYDFTVTDRYMTKMAAHGMRVLPVLFDAPPWHTKKRDKPEKGIFSQPKNGKAIGKFGAAVIKRYGRKGSFWRETPSLKRKHRKRSAIRAVQVWNEPNLRYYWGNRPNARQYAKVMKQAYKRIKRADRKVEVVTAGIPDSKTRRAVRLKKYLKQLHRFKIRRWSDTIGLNAYARNRKDLQRKVKLVRRIMNKRRNKRGKIWVTEIGWADTGNRSPFVKGRRGQAKQIRKAVNWMGKRKIQRRMKLRGFIYYQWRDAAPYREGIDAGTWGFHAGLLEINGGFKPAHRAFRRAVARLR